jgi:hypothetical protein
MSADVAWMEPTQPGDHYADYCQWPYDPLAPTGGKLRQASLLWASLQAAGAHPYVTAACRQLRTVLGPFRTVYGVKLQDGRLSFEFYFYDYARLDRALSIPKVLAALSPYVICDLPSVERRPYFMFSLDLDTPIVTGKAPLAEIDVYLGNPGSTVSSGMCYAHRSEGMELKNLYYFFDARLELSQIADKVATNAHLDAPSDLSAVLWQELLDCGVIVVANKRRHDGVYFSRIRSSQLGQFFMRAGWPAEIQALHALNAHHFEHLLFDIGIDYAVKDGRAVIRKTAFYGLL